MFNLIGSMNMFGNPASLLDSIGKGCKAFYFEPVDGFKKGFGAGVSGIFKGTASLVGNTA